MTFREVLGTEEIMWCKGSEAAWTWLESLYAEVQAEMHVSP